MDPIISLLKQNAKAPVEDLARQLECTEDEVLARIQALEEAGIVLGYTAIIDAEKLGNGHVTAIIEVRITPERGGGFDRLASRIAQFDQVSGCYLMSGGYDLLVMVEGDSLSEVARFISEKLSTIEGVISTATHFRLKCYKENGVLVHQDTSYRRLAITP